MEYKPAIQRSDCGFERRKTFAVEMNALARSSDIQRSFLSGASGDTELFEKASNINGFQGGRVANNLYISPFRATVFKTAALFLYPNSSVVIRVENLLFLSLWLAFRTGRGCFPIREVAEAYRQTKRQKSTLFIFRGRRCEDGCIPYRKDQGLHGHVQLSSAGYVAVAESEGAFISHAVPAGELGLHHEGPCPYLQGWH